MDNIITDLKKWELTRLEGGYIATTNNADLNIGAKFNHSKGSELAKKIVLNQFANWAKSIVR